MSEAALAISTGIKVISQLRAGEAASVASKARASSLEENAILARRQAAEEERRFRIAAKKRIGTLRANIGGSGVTIEGSPLDVLEESAVNSELDALTIRHGGEVTARGFLNKATLTRFAGKTARESARLSAVGTLIKGAGAASLAGG